MIRILYAIQGTGNGHLSRAMEVVPCLQKRAEVDVLVSGIQGDLDLPFPVKYKLSGLSFIFGKSGGIDLLKTIMKANLRKLAKSINILPVDEYDLVINDFEPISAWACYLRNKPCIGLSHQAAVISPHSPKPNFTDRIGTLVLHHYAPVTLSYGFHFAPYDPHIFTPVIRTLVRRQTVTDEGHYTVYLPAYNDDRLVRQLSSYPEIRWDVFSKHNKKPRTHKNVCLQPIDGEKFIKSMASSSGVLCGGGFETPSEALYLGKKLLVIPMKSQYEQHLNAAALHQMGIPVIKSLKQKHRAVITDWIENGKAIPVSYPDTTQQIVDMLLEQHLNVSHEALNLGNDAEKA